MEKLYKISISCVGVKKRCRKTELHHLSLGYIPYNDGNVNKEELLYKARNFIAENMKSVVGIPSVTLNLVERKKDGIFTIEVLTFFDKCKQSFNLTSLLENELC